jgi:hypothetical protein
VTARSVAVNGRVKDRTHKANGCGTQSGRRWRREDESAGLMPAASPCRAGRECREKAAGLRGSRPALQGLRLGFGRLGRKVFEHAVDVVVHGFGVFVFVARQIFGGETTPQNILGRAIE